MTGSGEGFEILLAGTFGRGQVVVHWSTEERKTSPAIERLIEAAWNARVADARRGGKMLYDGRLCRLVEYGVTDDILHLRLGPTSFRDLVGTNLTLPGWLRTMGHAYLSDALAVHATVASADRRIVIFKRSGRVAEYPGYYDVCGGHVEPDFDCVRGIPDPFAAIAREIEEETTVAPQEMQEIVCRGLARNTRTLKTDLLFSVRTTRASASLLRAPLDDEHAQVQLIDDVESIDRFVRRNGATMAPAGIASLRMHCGSV